MTALDDVMDGVARSVEQLGKSVSSQRSHHENDRCSYYWLLRAVADCELAKNPWLRERDEKQLKQHAQAMLFRQAAQAVTLLAESEHARFGFITGVDGALLTVKDHVRWKLAARNNPDGCTRYNEWAAIRNGWLTGGSTAEYAGTHANILTAVEAILLILDNMAEVTSAA